MGQLLPNAWGLFDFLGNNWEWCADFYRADYYKDSPLVDPPGPAQGKQHVTRGGSWCDSLPDLYRSAFRSNPAAPSIRSSGIGFRVVCEVGPAAETKK